MSEEFPEYVPPETQQAVDDLLDRLASRGYAPQGEWNRNYEKKLDWLYIIGFIYSAGQQRFIYRVLDAPPNLLGADDPSNTWNLEVR